MKYFSMIRFALLLGLLSATAAHGGTFSTATFTGNGDSGISSSNTYTHAVDLDGGPTTINGVVFAAGGNGSQAALKYDLEGAPNSLSGVPNSLSGSIASLDGNSFYAGAGPETLTLSGLSDSSVYQATFYSVGFGVAGGRFSNVIDGQGGSILYDQNVNGNGNGSLLTDTYTPVGGSITFTWTINTIDTNGDTPNSTTLSDPFLQFGFSNQLLSQAVPEPGTIALLGVSSTGLAAMVRRRRGRSVRSHVS